MLETAWESRWLPDLRGLSSVGRAPALQAGGQEFESLRLHRVTNVTQLYLENFTQIKISEEINLLEH